MVSAQWYGDAYWVEDPVEVEEIEISSNLAANFNNLSGTGTISVLRSAYTLYQDLHGLEAALDK
ncbi:MAG: hypothetical protein U5K00_10490 [Melioribacteraceae bacterium]|nr:hypothetical protein [Melioribacteraceae bacterium]